MNNLDAKILYTTLPKMVDEIGLFFLMEIVMKIYKSRAPPHTHHSSSTVEKHGQSYFCYVLPNPDYLKKVKIISFLHKYLNIYF